MAAKSTDESSDTRRKHFHVLKRFKKAASYSELLSKLATEHCDPRSAVEVRAYACWLKGLAAFEGRGWQHALDSFLAARTIYEKLPGTSSEQAALFHLKLDEIEPLIRYCTYHLQRGGTMKPQDITALLQSSSLPSGVRDLSDQLEALVLAADGTGTGTRTVSLWGKSATIKNAKVRVALIQAEDSLDAINKPSTSFNEKLRLYDQLLMSYNDANCAALDDLRLEAETATKLRTSRTEASSDALLLIQNVISFYRLEQTIARNRLLIDQLVSRWREFDTGDATSKPEDLVRLCDTIIQNVTAIQNLSQAQADASFMEQQAARGSYFRGLRCYYLAWYFLKQRKHNESSALLDRALEHLSQAKQRHDLASSTNEATVLEKKLAGRKAAICAIRYLGAATDQISEHATAMEPIFPPGFVAVPCKPLFFDLAHSGLEVPSVTQTVSGRQSPAPEQAGEKKASITGFLSNWWGGKK